VFKKNGLSIAWLHYSERRVPPWYRGRGDLREERHHVVFVARRAELVALTFSDPGFRSAVGAEIREGRQGTLRSLSFLTAKQVSDAFVGNRVRTLWLGGVHRRTTTKADSKILAGTDLEAALDPLEDQSYYFSSVRSTVPGAAVGMDAPAVVGVNPRNARVWLGPSREWGTFCARLAAVMDAAAKRIANPRQRRAALPVLAQPIDGLPNARNPYGLAVTGIEEISAGIEDEEDQGWIHDQQLNPLDGLSAMTGRWSHRTSSISIPAPNPLVLL
jgi:hypothetical protein